MKTLNEILQQPRLQVLRTGEDGGQGLMMLDYKKPNKAAVVVWSNGGVCHEMEGCGRCIYG